jgi:hypothetical protein
MVVSMKARKNIEKCKTNMQRIQKGNKFIQLSENIKNLVEYKVINIG